MIASSFLLRWKNVQALPLVHGRVAFAVAVRERMLAERHAVLAVELPESLKERVLEGIALLPRIHAVVYREWARDAEDRAWYVPIDPCDGIIEAIRIAQRERVPVEFMDAEVEQFAGRRFILPDPHALLTLGVEKFYEAALPPVAREHPPTEEDHLRERHMAARVAALAQRHASRGDVLFLCGMAHWERIRGHLERGDGALHAGEGPSSDAIALVPADPRSLFQLLGEMPFVTWAWERHRNSIELARHDTILAMKELLLAVRRRYARKHDDSLERATPAALATLLDYLRKLVVRRGRLAPDLWSLVVAAKGVVGNDFAVTLLETARRYPPNARSESEDEEALLFDPRGERAQFGDDEAQITTRAPGDARVLKRVSLIDRPPKIDRELWRSVWNPQVSCSWPPEDLVIENLRAYVSSRTLALAGIDRVRTEEFAASLKDGLAIRETLRDLALRKIHVKIEPRIPGKVGAVVMIFEEDDDGTRFPLRMTWMAEHAQESTLAFYATNFLDEMVGPGIGRCKYGGCLFLFPPRPIPDVWNDLRFEKARRPSERLLLAALVHARDRFVAYVAPRPPAPELVASATLFGRHVVHLPLSTFSARTLERVRRFHILNGQVVRSWAARFIR